VRQLCWSTS